MLKVTPPLSPPSPLIARCSPYLQPLSALASLYPDHQAIKFFYTTMSAQTPTPRNTRRSAGPHRSATSPETISRGDLQSETTSSSSDSSAGSGARWVPSDDNSSNDRRVHDGGGSSHENLVPSQSQSQRDEIVIDTQSRRHRTIPPASTAGHTAGHGRAGRRYTFVNRKKRDKSVLGKRTARWLAELEVQTEPKLRRTHCCKAFRCFQVVDFKHYMSRVRHIVSLSVFTRRTYLQSMRGANGAFYFNGKQVCSRFLRRGFHFSSDLMAADIDGIGIPDEVGGRNRPHGDQTSFTNTNRSSNGISSSESDMVDGRPTVRRKDTVVSFLKRLSEDCSDRMPDSAELHLPFFRKYEVYAHFTDEFKRLYPGAEPPTQHYFLRTWKSDCRNIKVRRTSRFTICDQCEQLRSALHKAILQSTSTAEIRRQKTEHNTYVATERMAYQMKRDRARLQPSDYCSIIIDGADQSAFGIPHFATTTKTQRGHALKVKLVGLLEHNVENSLFLFTMTEEHETGANHIIEAIHRYLNTRFTQSPLPRTLFVQLDNCSRENKNHFFMAYIEFLVAMRIFDVIELGFLPVGHTHEDIDQIFSQTSARLRANDAVTLPHLHEQLSHVNNGRTNVSHMKRITNWSGLCSQENIIQRVDNITRHQYFKFSRSFSSSDKSHHSPVSTCCHVKTASTDAWRPLVQQADRTVQGFLREVPDLSRTPHTSVKCPPNLENINKRFNSEEGRINSSEDMILLHELRDSVFETRKEPFHWNLDDCIETKKCFVHEALAPTEGDEDEIQPEIVAQPMSDPPHVRPQASSSSGATTRTNPVDAVLTLPPLQDLPQSSQQPQPQTQQAPPKQTTSKPFTTVNYQAGSFVLVRPENVDITHSDNFWLAKVLSVIRETDESFVRHLKVQWFDVYRDNKKSDRRLAPFYPCYHPVKSKRKRTLSCSDRQQPWTDVIDTDSVLVSFENLTRKNTLPLAAQKKIPL